jgi:ankyrin repeat protein
MNETNPANTLHPLPERADLEHLRKEAKRRLKFLRLDDPSITLAAVQLAIARDYGFSSWRRLAAYITALRDKGDRLRQAVSGGDLKTAGSILDDYPDLINANTDKTHRGERPSDTLSMSLLHVAIAANQIEMARLLLKRGADPNTRNADGRLPLHDCFELGRDEFKDLLLQGGAVPDVCAAAAYGMLERLREMLQREPALANDLSTGLTPLGWAAFGGPQFASARILIEHGAIIDRPPYDYKVWMPAAILGSIEMARFLLEHSASPDSQNYDGDGPLHLVIKSRLVKDPVKFIELLLLSGANPNLRNKKEQIPLDCARIEIGASAEEYFPPLPRGPKTLAPAIALLKRFS